MQVGQETFRLCQQVVDGLVLVDNRAVSAAIKVGASTLPCCCQSLHVHILPGAQVAHGLPSLTRPMLHHLGPPSPPLLSSSAQTWLLRCRMCSMRQGPFWSQLERWLWRGPRPTSSTTTYRWGLSWRETKAFPSLSMKSAWAAEWGSMPVGQGPPSAHPDSAHLAPNECHQQQPAPHTSQRAAAFRHCRPGSTF